MAVQHNAAAHEGWRLPLWRVGGEKIRQQIGLFRQSLCALAVWIKIPQLFQKDARAARLQDDERHAGIDLRREASEHIIQIAPRLIEETEIVERPSAADVPPWKDDAEAGAAQNACCCIQHLRLQVVVPGVRPQQDGLFVVLVNCGSVLLLQEATRSKTRQ